MNILIIIVFLKREIYFKNLNIKYFDVDFYVLQVFEHQDGSKSLKLGDFGLATVVDGPLYTICGTPTYVAPEIVAETGSVTSSLAWECYSNMVSMKTRI